ncbi:MAG: hypothetical protein KIT73_02870 [Burkholderiales bacterium]|nr:hypothetical protein [Burkholderiales bacterium]
MAKIDLSDDSLFGNEAAEDELENIFATYAVERQEVRNFLDADRTIATTRAYKGEGKSALLRLVGLQLRNQTLQPLIISTTGAAVAPEIDVADSDRWVRGWKASLLRLAAREIGATISVAFTDDAISLVEEAEANGFRSRSFVSSVVDRLKSSAVPVERSRTVVVNPEPLLRRWSQHGAPVWFFVDDIDQNFENTPIYRVRIAAFFVAVRQIVNQIPEFRFRLAIRPNVWAIIKREFEALSHVEQYVDDLQWSLNDFYQLLAKRIEGYLRRTNQWDDVQRTASKDVAVRNKQLIGMVFDDPMPWGKERDRPPAVILYTLSRHRPRWLIELSKHAAASAAGAKRLRINFDDINNELDSFGRRRIEDTVAEFKSQCPEIEELLAAFVGQPEWFSTADLMSTLSNRILQGVHPRIAGVLGVPSAKEVAHFLFQIGFLTARKDLPGGDYQHIAFSENPSLLRTRTNVDQGYSWEIHPVFRQPLKLKNVDERR